MNNKRIVIIVMVLVLLVGVVPVSANEGTINERIETLYKVDFNNQVQDLVDLGIIKGNEKGLELDKELTRVEGAIVYERVIGESTNAREFEKDNKGMESVFKDLPKWAEMDINFLYSAGKVKGISDTKFGPEDLMTDEQFMTLLLRGLGYDDTKGDFVWNKSMDKAIEIGIITEEDSNKIKADNKFTRGEMVKLSYNALFTPNKDTGEYLILENNNKDKYSNITTLVREKITESEQAELEKGGQNISSSLSKKISKLVQTNIGLVKARYNGESIEIWDMEEYSTPSQIEKIQGMENYYMVNTRGFGEVIISVNKDEIMLNSDKDVIMLYDSIILDEVRTENSIDRMTVKGKNYEDGRFDLDVYNGQNQYVTTITTDSINYGKMEVEFKEINKGLGKLNEEYYK